MIDQCFVHGENLPYNVAVVVPNWVNVAERLKLPNDPAKLAEDKSVSQLLLNEVTEQCAEHKHYEIPRRLVIARQAFTVENGMATPKMSLRRKQIYDAFGARIQATVTE